MFPEAMRAVLLLASSCGCWESSSTVLLLGMSAATSGPISGNCFEVGRPVESMGSPRLDTTEHLSLFTFPGGSVAKNPPANAGSRGLILVPGRSHLPQSSEPELWSLCPAAGEVTGMRSPHAAAREKPQQPQRSRAPRRSQREARTATKIPRPTPQPGRSPNSHKDPAQPKVNKIEKNFKPQKRIHGKPLPPDLAQCPQVTTMTPMMKIVVIIK